MNPFVSVIIPVYNVEKYIHQCIDSVINQTLKNIEIICINDGSEDASFSILQEYAQKDSRIILLNQKNLGVSVARNKGIKIARGKYIMFVDSDDWIESNAIELAYKLILEKNVDILAFGYNIYENGNVRSGFTDNFLTRSENKTNFSNNDLMNIIHLIWDKIYRRDFILDKKISFPEQIKLAEDGSFNLQCLIEKAVWGITKQPLYCYRINRKDSAMNKSKELIVNEFDALLKFTQSEAYKKASEELKIFSLEKFIGGMLYNYNRKKHNSVFLLARQIFQVRRKIPKSIPVELLNKTHNYKKLKNICLSKFILCQLFSLKNK